MLAKIIFILFGLPEQNSQQIKKAELADHPAKEFQLELDDFFTLKSHNDFRQSAVQFSRQSTLR